MAEGGRRCPGGHSATREAQAARQRLCRARKALAAAEATSGQAGAAATPADIVEARVRVAFDAATRNRPSHGWDWEHWMSMAKLRRQMPDIPRADLDAVLDRMLMSGQVRLMAELNQRALTQEDHAAAIDIADEPRHVISFNPDQAASAQAALAVAKQRVKDAEHEVTSLKQDAEQNCPERSGAGDSGALTAKSVAAQLGVSVGTVYQWLKSGQIEQHGYTGQKVNGRWILTPIAAAIAEPAKPQPVAMEDRIREAYASLATPNAWDPEWCSMTKLRAQLAGLDRDQVDDTLRAMERAGEIYIAPEADQKMLTDADRAAAIVIGGTPKHLFCINR